MRRYLLVLAVLAPSSLAIAEEIPPPEHVLEPGQGAVIEPKAAADEPGQGAIQQPAQLPGEAGDGAIHAARAEPSRGHPVLNLAAIDVPYDGGGALELRWELPAADGADGYKVLREKDGAFLPLQAPDDKGVMQDTVLPPDIKLYVDASAGDGINIYKVRTMYQGGFVDSDASTPARADYSLFHTKRSPVLILVALVVAVLLYILPIARRNPDSIYVRRIPGIDAVEEAIGRATEMGRPILYVPGIQEMTNIQTIASMLILGEVAKKVAEYNAKIIVPNIYPFVREVAEEVVRQGYYNAGNPDAFEPDSVPYLSNEQFAFTAGVNGIMLRNKPAANLFLGSFYAESLILAETGFQTGAIQVAGTTELHQLPFFVAACDYTLIGEELFAASAYLSKDPVALSTIKAGDWAKLAIIGIVIFGVLSETMFGLTSAPAFHAFKEFWTL